MLFPAIPEAHPARATDRRHNSAGRPAVSVRELGEDAGALLDTL